jgi:predicted AAA+ superfamily ATPase
MKIYIKREIENKVNKYSKNFPVVAISGPRQSGKSTMIKNIFPDIPYFSFDDLELRISAKSDPGLFFEQISQAEKQTIIDEIQYAPQLLHYIKMKVDENPRIKGRFFLTGSQQFLMIKNLSETLAGRIGLINVYPLSVSEIISYINENKDFNLFEFSAFNGTYPQLIVEKLDTKEWYLNYINTYLERDIKTLYNIGKLNDFEKFIRILAFRTGQILNLSSLASDIGVSVNTIKNWISILKASGIIFLLYPYHTNIRTQLVKSPKIYFIDIGLVCSINKIKDRETLFSSPLLGYIFENYCIAEILKRINNFGLDLNLYFYRDSKGVEIDLLIEDKQILYPVEIKASVVTDKKCAENIEKVKKKLKNFKDGFIINLSNKSIYLSPNVLTLDIVSFLNKISNL